MRQEYSVRIGERTAEDIKIAVGSALTELDNPPMDYIVRGPNIVTSLPLEIAVSYQKIAMALDKSIARLETAIINVLEQMPPELYADIFTNGIHLTGGGALLKGLDKRLNQKIGITFKVSEDPLRAVARGTGLALRNIEKFPFLM
jgi:rod shape-determining protein MreB